MINDGIANDYFNYSLLLLAFEMNILLITIRYYTITIYNYRLWIMEMIIIILNK